MQYHSIIVALPIGVDKAAVLIDDKIVSYTRTHAYEDNGWDPEVYKNKGLALIRADHGTCWVAFSPNTAYYNNHFQMWP